MALTSSKRRIAEAARVGSTAPTSTSSWMWVSTSLAEP